MQVIRQNDDRVNSERPASLYNAECLPKQIDMVYQQLIAMAFGAIYGEKIGCPFDLCSALCDIQSCNSSAMGWRRMW